MKPALLLIGGFVFGCASVWSQELGESSKLSEVKPDGYKGFPVLVLPVGEKRDPGVYEMILEKNTDVAINEEAKKSAIGIVRNISPTNKVFQATQLKPGESFKVNSYLIAESVFEAKAGIEKGPDYPKLEEIKSALDSADTEKFVRILSKLAEERRGPKDKSELEEVKKSLSADPTTDLFFRTGYLEISGEGIKDSKPDIRYFVAAREILEGAAKLDLKQAKLQAVRGVSLYLFNKLDGEITDPVLLELAKPYQSACDWKQCALSDNAKIGSFALQMQEIADVGARELLEPSADAILNTRKQLCALKSIFSICGDQMSLKKIAPLLTKKKIDCSKPHSWLKALK